MEYGAAKYKPADLDLVMEWTDVLLINYGAPSRDLRCVSACSAAAPPGLSLSPGARTAAPAHTPTLSRL